MADLLMFPQHRNVGKARHVAELYIAKRTEKDRDTYWRLTKDRLAGVMERCGFDDAEIDLQVEAFRSAVQDQINTIHSFKPHRGSDGGPGAA